MRNGKTSSARSSKADNNKPGERSLIIRIDYIIVWSFMAGYN